MMHALIVSTLAVTLLAATTAFAQATTQPAMDGKKTVSASGLTIIEISPGTGAKSGDTVQVHYTGKLQGGKVFDSSIGKDPISFKLGTGGVIKGWDEGIQGMQIGEKRHLTIPPDLAYGPSGRGPIPANSTLEFDVELVGVTHE